MINKPDIVYKRGSDIWELQEILKLQKLNHYFYLSAEAQKSNGFLTVKHSLELLLDMNNKCPHTIAVSDKNVVGYALSMLPSFQDRIPVLQPMFELLNKLLPEKNRKVSEYVIMGQICVSKEYREKGVFRGLYRFMEETLKQNYQGLITEVAISNARSLNAHYAIGFTSLYTHKSND